MIPSFLVLLSVLVYSSANGSILEGKHCSEYYSSNFLYGHFFKTADLKLTGNNGIHFEFKVQTESDAHIKFSERPYPLPGEPAYEVAIGAGKNSFSFIRRKEEDLSKIRLDTPSILSSSEPRGFWITISNDGRITVGQEEEIMPFMMWDDEDPLHVQYLSFSSWDNVSAKWFFNCSETVGQKQPHKSLASLSVKYRIMEEIFTERAYDRTEAPPPIAPTESNVTKIYAHLTSHHVTLDERRSTLDVWGFLTLSWDDRRLRWSSNNYENITTIFLKQYLIWTPDTIVYNSANIDWHMFKKYQDSRVTLQSNGSVKLTSKVHYSVFCKEINFQKWPKDQQKCQLQLGSWNPQYSLKMVLLEDGVQLKLEDFKTSSEWLMPEVSIKPVWIDTFQTNLGNRFSNQIENTNVMDIWMDKEPMHITVEFVLIRRNNMYFHVLIIPLAMILIFTLLSFWTSPVGKMKLTLQCLSLLTASLVLMYCWKTLPVHYNNQPQILSAYAVVMLMTCITIISSVAITNVTLYAPVNISHSVSSVLRSNFVAMLFCLPSSSDQVAMDYYLFHNCQTPRKEDLQMHGIHSNEYDTQWDWILISTIIQRIFFLVYIIMFSCIFSAVI